VPASHVERDWTQPYEASKEWSRPGSSVYRDPQQHWDLYQLGEELTDLEDAFRLWRFRHVTTVERVIGFKRGTGGTGGVSYLRKMLDVVLFPEIWQLRTELSDPRATAPHRYSHGWSSSCAPSVRSARLRATAAARRVEDRAVARERACTLPTRSQRLSA
jgi:hypothetical protein